MGEAQPRILGVVNITEDSFSDGGRYLDPEEAVAHARKLRAEGADVVELGAASSHPDARPVRPEQEIRRLEPVLDRLLGEGVPVAVDAFRMETQRYALERGVAYLNDVRGFPDPALYPALARGSCQLVVMHSIRPRGPVMRSWTDPNSILERIDGFFTGRLRKLEAAGIPRERIILDPGMGFFLGGNPEPSLRVLTRLGSFKERWKLPVLISISRKSVLGALTGRPVAERGAATLAAELFAASRGVDYIRTHDVRALRDALTVLAALRGAAS